VDEKKRLELRQFAIDYLSFDAKIAPLLKFTEREL
jgi:hypothetical protein